MIKVSVILPVYNTEKYLPECLDSIINQSLRDIEIICIDDGSTDSSLQILKEYAEKDKRIVVLEQKNSGAGIARNKGMEVAKGKYLSFLDSDDFFEPEMLEKAYIKCEEENADFCVYRSKRFDDKTHDFESIPWTIKERYLPEVIPFKAGDADKYIFQVFNGWAWDKLYNRNFVTKTGLKYQGLRTTNDAFFVFMANVEAKCISIIDEVLAYHRVNTGTSLSVTREKSWDCCYQAMDTIKKELKARNKYSQFQQSYINWALHFCLWNVKTLTGNAKKELLKALQKSLFKELEITGKSQDYFYDKNEYKQYLNICKYGVETEVEENIILKAYRFYRYCGFKATVKKVIETLMK